MNKAKLFLKNFFKIVFIIYKWTAVVIGTLTMTLVILIIMIVSAVSKSAPTPSTEKIIKQGGSNKIAVLRLNGQIMETVSGYDTSIITPAQTSKVFRKLGADHDVKAVVLYINSPGGAVVATDQIYNQIMELRKSKPVIVALGGVAASGGYYLAAAGDQIVANPATITGSIGVIAKIPNLSALFSKIGVNSASIKSGQYKDMGSMERAMTTEEKAIFQSLVDDSYDLFISIIVAGRDMDEQVVRKLADGRIYSGKQALANGLVDQLGDIDAAIDLAEKTSGVRNPTVLEYKLSSWFESFMDMSTKNLGLGASLNNLPLQNQSGMYYLWEY